MGAYPGHYSTGAIMYMYMYNIMCPYGEHGCSTLNHCLYGLSPGCMTKESLGEKGTKQIHVHNPIILYKLGMFGPTLIYMRWIKCAAFCP